MKGVLAFEFGGVCVALAVGDKGDEGSGGVLAL